MDTNSTPQAATSPEPSLELEPPGAAAAVTLLPQEATGDSDDDDASVRTAGRSSSSETADEGDDDAESCSGSFGGGCSFIGSVNEDDGFEEDDVETEDDATDEVDSKMAVPWWRRTAAKGDGGCAPAEGERKLADGGRAAAAAAESNRLFWEACIARGY